jgi:hypothetical protein
VENEEVKGGLVVKNGVGVFRALMCAFLFSVAFVLIVPATSLAFGGFTDGPEPFVYPPDITDPYRVDKGMWLLVDVIGASHPTAIEIILIQPDGTEKVVATSKWDRNTHARYKAPRENYDGIIGKWPVYVRFFGPAEEGKKNNFSFHLKQVLEPPFTK